MTYFNLLFLCEVWHYRPVVKLQEDATWRRNWSVAFYLTAKITAVETMEEFWAFDISDTLNGIGGVLGLYLGGSIYYILLKVYLFIESLVIKWVLGNY